MSEAIAPAQTRSLPRGSGRDLADPPPARIRAGGRRAAVVAQRPVSHLVVAGDPALETTIPERLAYVQGRFEIALYPTRLLIRASEQEAQRVQAF